MPYTLFSTLELDAIYSLTDGYSKITAGISIGDYWKYRGQMMTKIEGMEVATVKVITGEFGQTFATWSKTLSPD